MLYTHIISFQFQGSGHNGFAQVRISSWHKMLTENELVRGVNECSKDNNLGNPIIISISTVKKFRLFNLF